MSVTTLDEQRLSQLVDAAICHPALSEPRKAAAGRVLDHLSRSEAIAVWAQKLAPPRNTMSLVDSGEVAQIIAEALQQRFVELQPEQAARVRRWSGWGYWKARQAVRNRLETSSYTVASGMATVMRRYARVKSATEQARKELGRAPTREEVIAVANAGREARARRDGTLVTHADFGYQHLPKSIDAEIALERVGHVRESQLLLAPDTTEELEARENAHRLASRLLAQVRATLGENQDVEAVGHVWLDVVVSGSRMPTPSALAQELGWARGRAADALSAWSATVAALRDDGALDFLRGR
ncbi:MAG: hypothetical protein ACTH0V_00215 [Microbacteriaceae bacterium]